MINRVLKVVISIFFLIGYKFYSAIYYISNKKFPSTFVVLTYHAISNDQKHKFARQMDMLKRYNPVFPNAKIDLNAGKHYVAVTFDDGFENVVENALPELVKRNIPATLFIPTGYLGKKPGWIINLKKNKINESVMSPERLQALNTELIKIGSHSVNHRSLTQLHEEEAMMEFVDSKMYLETLLHGKITTFSFPYGAYNNTVLELAKRAGYKNVFCSLPLFPQSRMNGLLIGRTVTDPDDNSLEFKLKLLGAYQWLPLGITIKRQLFDLLQIGTSDSAPSAETTGD